MNTTTLAHALSASDQSITLTDAGDLVTGQLLALDAEYCRILFVLTSTQALLQRGVNGTPSAPHLAGVTVSIDVPENFLTGPQVLPAFGIDTNVLTGLGPSDQATFKPGGGGSGTPALPFDSVQFNNAGSFGGSADFTWLADGLLVARNAGFGNQANINQAYFEGSFFDAPSNITTNGSVGEAQSALLIAANNGNGYGAVQNVVDFSPTITPLPYLVVGTQDWVIIESTATDSNSTTANSYDGNVRMDGGTINVAHGFYTHVDIRGGTVSQNVQSTGGDIDIRNTANVGGNVVGFAAAAIVTEASTTISGDVIGVEIPNNTSGVSGTVSGSIYAIRSHDTAHSVFDGSITATDFVWSGTKTANRVLAGPTTGSPAIPTFRALVSADIPAGAYGGVTSLAGTANQITASAATGAVTLSIPTNPVFSGTALTFPGALSIASGKTLTASNTLTIVATDGITMTTPTTSFTAARTDAAQTFTGIQTAANTYSWKALGATANDFARIDASGLFVTTNSVGQLLGLLGDSGGHGVLSLGAIGSITWQSTNRVDSGSVDLILSRAAAATIQMGADVNGAAIAQTLQAANGITGADRTGGNFTVASGKGTGAGAVSSLIFQTPTVLGSGTTAQSLTTRLTLSSAGATFASGITTIGGATFHTTSSALTDGAGAQLGTLATAPTAGNPTKWIGINDNGTVRYIPAW